MMPWSGAGKSALVLFEKARVAKTGDFRTWAKLGLALYDGEFYPEALEAFSRAAELTDGGAWVIVWQGHILDILGRREEALERYRKALERGKGLETQHDQYGMTINRQWVEERLRTPFRRK
jgi:tetratricopeptide (TPR) repeat protein